MKRSTQLILFGDAALPPHYSGADDVTTSKGLIALAVALGAETVKGWTDSERRLLDGLPDVPRTLIGDVRERIGIGDDPLGDIFCRLWTSEERRKQGATYTPKSIVEWMLGAVTRTFPKPARVVDAGAGSGRFMVAAGRQFPQTTLIGVELDPVPAVLARANLAAAGMADRASIIVGDYRRADLGTSAGRTLFVANPPYVRHHQIGADWKTWLTASAREMNLRASQLAGLHVHFFLSTAMKARPGDFGSFITAAEWLDVNYGELVRELFLERLGGQRIDVIEPTAMPFPDAASTAAITMFGVGSRPKTVTLRRVTSIEGLKETRNDHPVRRERLESESRWSHLTRASRKGPQGYVELGELCRVHRGQVTGANKVWIAGEHSAGLPESVLCPTVTKAKELFQAGKILDDASDLRRVIDLPPELDEFRGDERKAVERFIDKARRMGADKGYVANNRRAWWSVGLREAAPILATYMARRPPAFVMNKAKARHINVAHGLYPREKFGTAVLIGLVDHLASAVSVTQGRTYAGGLTKFEPREMERLMVPSPEILRQGATVR